MPVVSSRIGDDESGLLPIPENSSSLTSQAQRSKSTVLRRPRSMTDTTALISRTSYHTDLEYSSSTRVYSDRRSDVGLAFKRNALSFPSSQSQLSLLSPVSPGESLRLASNSIDGLNLSLRRSTTDMSIMSDSSENVGLNLSNHTLSDIEAAVPVQEKANTGFKRKLLSRISSENLCIGEDDGSVSSSVGSMRSSFGKNMSSMGKSFRRRPKKDTAAASTLESSSAPSYDFLKKDESKDKGSLQGGNKWWHSVFLFSLLSLLACIITLWAPHPIGARMPSAMVAQFPWSDGCQGIKSCICPRETICADDILSMIFLTIARSSVWFDYPLYMLLFLSKARNTNNFLQKTMLKCWINFADFHKVHALFGIIVGIESTSHAFFHLLRWARRKDDIQFLWTHQTGITGLIALIICPFIVLPMTMPFLKKSISFEWRKGLHYLSILWGACLMFHAPQRIYWLIGAPLLIYVIDRFFGVFYKTHLVENVYFERLGDSSCIVTFENPSGFGKQNSAYVYVMLPWLSKYQFHAFSVYPCNKANHSQLCISKAGGWTSDLITEITTPTHKPAFIVGPFLSPFCSPAMNSENLIAVASGIGVTPTISIIKQYLYTSRRLNLIWICRDAGLVEWFLENVPLSDNGYTLIYYTGKRPLVIEKDLPANVLIYQGRPNLERTISEIIVSIATGEGLDQGLNGGLKSITNSSSPEIRAKLLLEKATSIYTMDQLFNYAMEVSNGLHQQLELDPLVDAVDYRGVSTLFEKLLKGSYNSIKGKLVKNFELRSYDAFLKRDDFESFMNLMLKEDGDDEASVASARVRSLFEGKSLSVGELGSQYHKMLHSKAELRVQSVLSGDGKYAARNWSMFYCGGSEAVLHGLKEYKAKYGMGLSVEKFDW